MSSADIQALQYLYLGVLFPKRKGSGGHLVHVSWQCSTWLKGYQAPSISLRLGHGSLLPEGNPPNQCADSLRRCYGERVEEGLQGGGRKMMERRMSRAESTGNDNVCEVISLWQGPPHPQGGLGATRLQPQCSVLWLSLMTLRSHLTDKCADNTCLQYLTKMYHINAAVFVKITYIFNYIDTLQNLTNMKQNYWSENTLRKMWMHFPLLEWRIYQVGIWMEHIAFIKFN